jgi:hypothetical protein
MEKDQRQVANGCTCPLTQASSIMATRSAKACSGCVSENADHLHHGQGRGPQMADYNRNNEGESPGRSRKKKKNETPSRLREVVPLGPENPPPDVCQTIEADFNDCCKQNENIQPGPSEEWSSNFNVNNDEVDLSENSKNSSGSEQSTGQETSVSPEETDDDDDDDDDDDVSICAGLALS